MERNDLFSIPAERLYAPNAIYTLFSQCLEILPKERLYGSHTYDDLETLIVRFLNAHAASDSHDPLDQIQRKPTLVLNVRNIWFWRWKNGAIFYGNVIDAEAFAAYRDLEPIWLLWVDDATAETWGYPPHCGWFHTLEDDDHFRHIAEFAVKTQGFAALYEQMRMNDERSTDATPSE